MTFLCIFFVGVFAAISAWLARGHVDSNEPAASACAPLSQSKDSLRTRYQSDPYQVNVNRQLNMKKYKFKHSVEGIDRRSNLSLQEYYDVYDSKWPVLLTDVVDKWPAWGKWTPDYFNECCGEDRVHVNAVHVGIGRDDGIRSKSHLKKPVGIAVPLSLFRKNVRKSTSTTWTYLTDELFLLTHPRLMADVGDYVGIGDTVATETGGVASLLPFVVYLKENYFDYLPSELKPWSAMILWGTKFSRSTTHLDPYNWTGTNAVLYGSKQWKMYPPNQDHKLNVGKSTNAGFPLSSFKYNSDLDGFDNDTEKRDDLNVLEFTQSAGELLIIPSGWIHQVFNAYNPEQSIAVSSQMFTRNNLRTVLEEIIIAAEYNYGSEVKRNNLPIDVDSYSDEQKVKAVVDLLPPWVLEKGKKITEDVVKIINKV